MNLWNAKPEAPLAERLRPECIEEVIGQKHLLAEGKPLYSAFATKKPHSMILWGPPGVGKTTIARLTAKAFDAEWIALSAVFSGVKDIRASVEKAEEFLIHERKTILFIDEIHRFNKAQQDALLPYTESGLITFIGATTENPSFEVNSALLSRAQVYVLKSLSYDDLVLLFERAKQKVSNETVWTTEAVTCLISFADGDARRLLSMFEKVILLSKEQNNEQIDLAFLEQVIVQGRTKFDKNGDLFYDYISALHKSVRGSNPDAALYWFCKMLDAGVDPNYLSRRIIRMAWEDIGLADPRGLQIANDAAQTYERLGSPEGELALAQAIIYLSIAAKSNAGYKAFSQAMDFVKNDKSREVPLHLRNAPTKLMKELNHGKAYRYPHDEPNGYAAGQRYFPDDMEELSWYKPVQRGLETKIAEKLSFLRQATLMDNDH